jgi:hypothetical protein
MISQLFKALQMMAATENRYQSKHRSLLGPFNKKYDCPLPLEKLNSVLI